MQFYFQAAEGEEASGKARDEEAVQMHHGEDIQLGALRRSCHAAGSALGGVPVLPSNELRARGHPQRGAC